MILISAPVLLIFFGFVLTTSICCEIISVVSDCVFSFDLFWQFLFALEIILGVSDYGVRFESVSFVTFSCVCLVFQ